MNAKMREEGKELCLGEPSRSVIEQSIHTDEAVKIADIRLVAMAGSLAKRVKSFPISV
jgi:hypothetical protein